MADARVPYLLSYVLTLLVVVAATVLCFAGRISGDAWGQAMLAAFGALGLIHMPSPAELLRRSGGLPLMALVLLGGCEASVRMPPRDVPAQVSPLGGTAIDYLTMAPRLAPSSPGRGVVYTDSQTGRVRFLDAAGGSIEAGTAARVLTLMAAPSSPEEGRFYENTIGHYLAFWDGSTWQTLATASSSVPGGRLINTTAPLAGGGNLSADRTLSLVLAGTPGLWVTGGGLAVLPKLSGGLALDAGGVYIDSTAVTPGSYPTAGQIATFTVGADGRFTAAGSSSDGSGLTGVQAAGISLTGQTLWASPAVGEVGYISGNKTLSKAKADSALTANAVCAYQGSAGACQTDGPQRLLFESGLTLTAGDEVFLSASVAGRVTNVQPIVIGQFVEPLGWLNDASDYDSMSGSAQPCVWRPSVASGPLGSSRAAKAHR